MQHSVKHVQTIAPLVKLNQISIHGGSHSGLSANIQTTAILVQSHQQVNIYTIQDQTSH